MSIKGDNQCFDWFDYPLNISEATGGLVSSNATQGYENRYNLINIDNEKEQMLPLLSTIQLKKSSGQVPDLQKLSRIPGYFLPILWTFNTSKVQVKS